MGWTNAGGWGGHGWGRAIAAGGANNIALNGTPKTATAGASPLALPSFTCTGNCIILVAVAQNSSYIVSISDGGAGLTWAQRSFTSSSNDIQVWWARASSGFSGVVTVNTSPGSPAYIEAIVCAFSGVNATPWDANASLPAAAVANSVSGVSTTSANDCLFVCARNGVGGGIDASLSPTATATYMWAGYKLVSAAQSGISFTDTTGTGNGIIADALVST